MANYHDEKPFLANAFKIYENELALVLKRSKEYFT